MKALFVRAMLLGWALRPPLANAQSGPAPFPLAGDWEGTVEGQVKGTVEHVVLHMNSTPDGKMSALLDNIDLKVSGVSAIGGSFDGTHLILRFGYWKPNSNRDFESRVATYEATVNESGSDMTGDWNQEGTRTLNFKRVTWQAKIPKPAPPTDLDGDWEGVEYESRGIKIHFIFHIHNTEDGLMALLDCPEEKFKGDLASKVSYDQASRQLSITIGQSIFTGKMTADGKALDTSMTEPGFHFLIHFDRLHPKTIPPN
jgi:hypothetical protein